MSRAGKLALRGGASWKSKAYHVNVAWWHAWYACRLYNFFTLPEEGCYCSNNASSANILTEMDAPDNARVGYSEC